MENTKRTDREKLALFLMNNKALIILTLYVITVCCLSDKFFTARNISNIFRLVCTSCTLATGFTLVLASGSIDLSTGAMLGMLGVFSAKLAVVDLPAWVVIALTILIGAFCGLFNAAVVSSFELEPFIVTLATSMMFDGVTMLVTKGKAVSGIPDWYVYIGSGSLSYIPFSAVIMVVALLVMHFIVAKTLFGRYALANGGNRKAAYICGINTKKIRYCVYTTMGIYAGIAAMLLTGRTASAQTSAGSGMALDCLAAVVIGGTPMCGGKANVIGTFVGCLLVQVMSNSLNILGVDSNWQNIAKGTLIVLAIALDTKGTDVLNRIRIMKKADHE